MDDLNLLFRQAEAEYKHKEEDIIEKVISDSKEEFNGYSEEHKSRAAEIKKLNERIKTLTSDLNKNRNIKSARPNHRVLNDGRAKRRKNIKCEIDKCRLRLKEIEEETRPLGDGKKKDECDEAPPMKSSISGLTKTPFL